MTQQKMEANFSTLILSIASSAAMALGLAPHPETKEITKDLDMAKFNIDLLGVLQNKTNGNLDSEESQFLESIVSDLRLKFVQQSQ